MNSKKTPSKLSINKKLLLAAESGNTGEILELLDLGADVEYKKSGIGQTPLMLCCKNGDLENSQLLLSRGANINAVNNDHQMPLFFAIMSSNVDLIRFLIEDARIEMNCVNGRTQTPLSLLINVTSIDIKDKCKLVSIFLEKGSNLILKYVINVRTALVLNDADANPNARFSENALLIAVEFFLQDHDKNYKKIVKHMLRHSSKENLASAANFQDNNKTNVLLKILLDEGSRNTSKSIRKQFELTDMLLEKGGDINHRFQEYDQIKRTQIEIPLFIKLCANSQTPLSTIEYVINYTDLKTTDEDIEKLENIEGDACRIFQMRHELAKHNINIPFEANQDVIEMMFGRIANSKSKSSSEGSSKSSKSSSKGSKEGGKKTRKKI
jgi:ankyrin repeat protein